MIWLILLILTLGTLLYVCAPLYSEKAPQIVQEDIDAYRAEMGQVQSDESVNLQRQLLQRSAAKPVRTAIPRAWLGAVFVGSFALSAAMYFSLGKPQWATHELPRLQPQTLPTSDVDAIAQMSPEDQQAMIIAMVDGLAARLKDDPENVEGWVRLLRSRQVLGQDATEDIALMQATFAAQPDVISDILERSGRGPQADSRE